MKRGLWIGMSFGLLTGLLIMLGAPPLQAQISASYDLDWNTIDNGGMICDLGGNYQLSATIGQFDANTLSSSNYTLNAGWWNINTSTCARMIYLPIVLRT